MKAKKKRYRKYFVKVNDEICVVGPKFFDELDRQKAEWLAIGVFSEINRCLIEEALDDCSYYIGTIKVVDGLARTLEALEFRFPFTLSSISAIDRRNGGLILARA